MSRIMVAWQPVGIAMGVYDVCHRYALLFFVVNLSTIHFVITISPFTTDLLHHFFLFQVLVSCFALVSSSPGPP